MVTDNLGDQSKAVKDMLETELVEHVVDNVHKIFKPLIEGGNKVCLKNKEQVIEFSFAGKYILNFFKSRSKNRQKEGTQLFF